MRSFRDANVVLVRAESQHGQEHVGDFLQDERNTPAKGVEVVREHVGMFDPSRERDGGAIGNDSPIISLVLKDVHDRSIVTKDGCTISVDFA